MTLVHVPSGPGRAQLRMHLALMATWILWGWSCGSPVFRLPSCCGEPPSSGWEQTNPTNMERGGFWWNLISDHLRSLWSKDYRSSRLLLTGVFQLYRVIYIYIYQMCTWWHVICIVYLVGCWFSILISLAWIWYLILLYTINFTCY